MIEQTRGKRSHSRRQPTLNEPEGDRLKAGPCCVTDHYRSRKAAAGCLEEAAGQRGISLDSEPPKALESNKIDVDFEVGGIHPTSDLKIKNLRREKTTGYAAKTTTPPQAPVGPCQPASNQRRSPRRRRTEEAATEKLDRELKLSPEERARAICRIRRSLQPNVAVHRIIEAIRRQRFQTEEQGPVDSSDVQELLVRLIRRDGGVWAPQTLMLQRLDEAIATRGMTRRAFNAKADRILNLPQALPKEFLARERAFQADGGSITDATDRAAGTLAWSWASVPLRSSKWQHAGPSQ